MKQVTAAILETRKLKTALRYQSSFCEIVRGYGRGRRVLKQLTLEVVARHFESLKKRGLHARRVTLLALKHWVQLGYGGITDEAREYIRVTAAPRQTRSTVAQIRCTRNGAYSELEFSGLQSALNAAYAAGEVSTFDYAMAVLSLTLAPRPSQLSLLKARHLVRAQRSDGSFTYILNVPRVKQRDTSGALRARKLSDAIGAVLWSIAEEGRALGREAGVPEHEVPLFWSTDWRSPLYTGPKIPFQLGAALVSARMKRALEGLDVKSERTGSPIKARPIRSRRTLGTRAAAEGLGALVIAELLDHSEASSARPYIEARPEMLKRIDKAVALQLAPLAQRFAGKLASRREGLQYKRHVFAGKAGEAPEDVGGCGKHSFCGLVAPLACYTCIHFRPWIDAPHEQILGELTSRRTAAASDSIQVASALDETILAVAEVVLAIARLRGLEGPKA
jgi:hypothetical protein